MDSKLRVGILLDSVCLPAWAITAMERTVCSNYAELTLVILNQSPPQKNPFPTTIWRDSKQWLYHLFNALDEKLFLRGPSASAQVNSSTIFPDVPVLEIEPINQDNQQYFSAADIEQIKSYRLDVLVKMGFGRLRGELLRAATYGVWAYRWGDHRKIEDGLLGFWEVIERWPETGAALQQLGVDGQQPMILCESWFFTYPYSPARSRNYILWAAASFLPRQVERLYRLGGEKFFAALEKNCPNEGPGASKSNHVPANLVVLRLAVQLVVRNLVEIFRRAFYREQWELLFRFGEDAERDVSTFRAISPSKDCFWADPHVIYREPNYYIFVEEYPYRTKRGHISAIEMDPQGNHKPAVPVLQTGYHLSFPSVFEWLGHYYMIPESSEKKTIDLYECTRFPDQWKWKMTLMKDVRAVDTTVVYWGGKWWLFTALAEQEAAAPQFELFLFYSEELFTDQWQAHPMNPIVSDVKKARAAGSILKREGRLVRPSQYGSSTYGYGFDLNEIVNISETEYSERRVASVRPDQAKNVTATHTYANQKGLTVIDALTNRWKWTGTS